VILILVNIKCFQHARYGSRMRKAIAMVFAPRIPLTTINRRDVVVHTESITISLTV